MAIEFPRIPTERAALLRIYNSPFSGANVSVDVLHLAPIVIPNLEERNRFLGRVRNFSLRGLFGLRDVELRKLVGNPQAYQEAANARVEQGMWDTGFRRDAMDAWQAWHKRMISYGPQIFGIAWEAASPLAA